jgi:hypothetical protein
MEHNFMMSQKGRENFKNQVQQVVGSIQNTNDIDVQVALITAPSYAKVGFNHILVNHSSVKRPVTGACAIFNGRIFTKCTYEL